MKTKRSKRIVSMMCAIMLFASVLANTASANNHTDRPFEFKFTNGGSWVTQFLEKEDTSNCYMYCNSTTNSNYYFTARVEGSFYSGNPSAANKWDASHGYRYTIRVGTETTGIRNWVKDNYPDTKVYAGIVGTPSVSTAFTTGGVWSPDNYAGIGI